MNVYGARFVFPSGLAADGEFVTDLMIPAAIFANGLSAQANGFIYTGAVPTPVWAAVPNYLNQTGTLAQNILTGFVTPSSGTTLSIYVNGVLNGALPTGWTWTGGTTLNYNGTSVNASPSSIYWIATNAGLSTQSNTIQIQGQGSGVVDNIAPTIPLGLSIGGITQTAATVTGNQSTDPQPPGTTASGLGNYLVHVKTAGADIAGSPFSVSPGGTGLVNSWVSTTVGSGFTTSMTQTGADLAISTNATDAPYPTASGVGGGAFQFTASSGTVIFCCRIDAFTVANPASNAYDNLRIELRSSLAANAQYVAVLIQASNSNSQLVQGEYRSTAGGNATKLTTVNTPSFPGYLFIVWTVSSNLFQLYYSADGNTLQSLGSATISMGTTLYALAGGNSGTSGGSTVTGTIKQVCVQSLPQFSLSLSTLSAGTSYAVSAVSQDADANASAASNAVNFTTTTASSWASSFPLKASYRIGNPQAYGSAFQTWAASQNLVILNAQFEAGNAGGFLAANGYTKASVVEALKANATAPGGMRVLQYVIFDQSTTACGPMNTIAQNSNFYLYQTNQSGTKVAGWQGSGYQYNSTPDTAANSNGYHLEDAGAVFSYQTFVTPGGNGNNANFDGFFHDNLFKQPRTNSGDYLVNGTTQSPSDSTVAAAWRQGEALFFSKMNSLQSGMILLGNLDGPASRTSYNGATEYSNLSGGVINGGLLEGGMGIYFAPNTYAGLMSEIIFRKQVALGSSLPIAFVGAINMTSTGQLPTAFSGGNPSAYSANYQGERYFWGILALSQTSGGINTVKVFGAWTTSSGYYDNQALFDFDEAGGNTAQYPAGYMGAPSGNNVTLSNGLVCQLFANGLVVVNPGGNGAQSFNQSNLTTLGVATAYRLRGPQNPSFNNAAQVTNGAPVSLADSGGYCGDAVFLMYAPQ